MNFNKKIVKNENMANKENKTGETPVFPTLRTRRPRSSLVFFVNRMVKTLRFLE